MKGERFERGSSELILIGVVVCGYLGAHAENVKLHDRHMRIFGYPILVLVLAFGPLLRFMIPAFQFAR